MRITAEYRDTIVETVSMVKLHLDGFKNFDLKFLCICNYIYKKHLKNVGPIRHCEPPHAVCFT